MAKTGSRESPLYIQLASEFRRFITRGVWPIGSQIPTVKELMKSHGVARVTIRRAMDMLAEEGLVRRSRGVGTYVEKAPEVVSWRMLTVSWDEYMNPPAGGRTTIVEESPAKNLPTVTANEGRFEGDYQYVRAIGRRNDGPPLMERKLYVQNAVLNDIRQRIPDSSTLPLLAEHTDRVTVFNEISAANVELAQTLSIPVGTPVIQARRIGINRKGVIVFVEFANLRGEYVKYQLVVERQGVTIDTKST